MSIQPPHPPASIKSVPAPRDPPSIQDVMNAINYVDEIKIGYKISEPGCPTAEDLTNAYVYQSSVISARAGSAVVPPWFHGAVEAALADGLKPLEQKMDQLKAELEQVKEDVDQVKADVNQLKVKLKETSRTTNQTYNLQCGTGEFRPYKIVRFIDGTSPLDDSQLCALYTVQDIHRLGVRQVQKYLEGYGLPSDLANPKEAIAAAIGCSTDERRALKAPRNRGVER